MVLRAAQIGEWNIGALVINRGHEEIDGLSQLA